MVAPPRVNVTSPATLVVATSGGVVPGNVAFAPLNTTVGVVVAAEAVPTLNTATPPRAMAPTASTEMNRFTIELSCLMVGGTTS